MISLFDLWEELAGTVNTHQGGHIKPNRNFTKWANTISLDIFKDMVEDYQRSQVMSDELTIFLSTVNVIVPRVPAQKWDIIKLPDTYKFFASAKVVRRAGDNGAACCDTCDTIDGATGDCKKYIDPDEIALEAQAADDNLTEWPIEKVPTNRWAGVCNHVNLPPTLINAKITQYDQGFKLAPKGLGIIVMDYFRTPRPATFAFTILNPGAENEYIQYDAVTSLPLEWGDTMIPEFLARLQKKYGRFVREQVIEQAGKDDTKI